MTALDDFIAEHDRPLRRRRAARSTSAWRSSSRRSGSRAQPELAAALDRLESATGGGELLEVAEDVRLRAMLFQHNVFFQRAEQLDRATAPVPRAS